MLYTFLESLGKARNGQSFKEQVMSNLTYWKEQIMRDIAKHDLHHQEPVALLGLDIPEYIPQML